MRKTLFIILDFLIFSIVTLAQILKPIKWRFSAPVKSKAGMYKVSMTVVIEKGWHIYSQNVSDGGPLTTKINFAKNDLVLLGGKVKEVGEIHKVHEEAFGVDVHYYKDKVDFVQVVKLKMPVQTVLSGTVEFMACNAEQCLPPEEVEFNIQLK